MDTRSGKVWFLEESSQNRSSCHIEKIIWFWFICTGWNPWIRYRPGLIEISLLSLIQWRLCGLRTDRLIHLWWWIRTEWIQFWPLHQTLTESRRLNINRQNYMFIPIIHNSSVQISSRRLYRNTLNNHFLGLDNPCLFVCSGRCTPSEGCCQCRHTLCTSTIGLVRSPLSEKIACQSKEIKRE